MLAAKCEPPKFLVVDDEPAMQRSMQSLLEAEGYRVETAGDGTEALERLHRQPLPDVILLDLLMPGLNGLQTLQQMRQITPTLRIVMLSGITDSRKVVQALHLGAADYLRKPLCKQDLVNVLRPMVMGGLRYSCPSGELIEDLGEGVTFVTATGQLQKLRAQAERIAQVNIPVLLLGESGTGKEVFARIIHRASPRAGGPFLKVNCAALPEQLLESELFGYEAGAFTGATHAKPGKFELCHRGTILLDEIGEMSPMLQAKLLHVLQDGQFSRLGSRCTSKTDVRVIAATNVDISRALAAKHLREDLYYRLSGFTLRLPPLRERPADIVLLLRHFMASLSERFACPALPISQATLDACLKYSWPGNVRELENFVKRCLVLQEFTRPASDLPFGSGPQSIARAAATGLKAVARSAQEDAEARAIMRVLQQTNWNRKQAAEHLKISYKALLYKVREYELMPPLGGIPAA